MSGGTLILCPNCGARRDSTDNFCGKCGFQFRGSQTNPSTVLQNTLPQPPITPKFTTVLANTIPPFLQQSSLPTQRRRGYIIWLSVLMLMLLGASLIGVIIGKVTSSGTVHTPQSTPSLNSSLHSVTPLATGKAITTVASPSPTPTPSPSPTPTKPSIVAGQTLYETTNFNGWSGSSDWTVRDGMLYNDGTSGESYTGAPTILAPYNLDAVGVSDYAVEVKIQVVHSVACFAITIRGTATPDGWHGYAGGIQPLCSGVEGVIISSSSAGLLNHASFTPGNSWHTYRLEVRGDTIRFLVDGVFYLQATDTQYFSGGQVGLWSYATQLIISSLKIIAL